MWSRNSIPGYRSKEKDICTCTFIGAMFTITKIWKQPKFPLINEWIKMLYVHVDTHTHNGTLLNHKKNEILPSATTWMDLEDIMLSEISQTEKDKHYMWNIPREGNGSPLQYSCLKNPKDREGWQATVHGVSRVGHDLATKLLLLHVEFRKHSKLTNIAKHRVTNTENSCQRGRGGEEK